MLTVSRARDHRTPALVPNLTIEGADAREPAGTSENLPVALPEKFGVGLEIPVAVV